MNIDELKAELQDDLKIEMDKLDQESIKIPYKHGKWLGLALDVQGQLVGLRAQMKGLQMQKRNYYMGRAPAEVYKKRPWNVQVLKSEVQTYIDADAEVRTLKSKIESREILLQFLEGAAKAVMAKQWNIKNAIEFAKFSNGVV